MSEIVNEAVIKVSADASGVETGLREVEKATAKTGKNLENLAATAGKASKSLENLGSTPGLRTVGDGAGAAAGKVDSATKSMAEAIQRATATMNVGAKGSAAYYAALANTRGLNVAALQPYLDQLDAVTKKTAQAAAAQRQLDEGNNFLAGLRSQADGIGKTASQLAALRAEQLGVADDARPLIEQLGAAEEAAGNAGNSVSGFAAALAAAGASAGIASVVQLSDAYGSYLAQLKLATTGQSEFLRAQASTQQIAASAQSDLASTASLYASITKSTRDLGIAQAQVANITEVVSLALKVSGASTQSASSAILQLSQAFASGVLRGEEFNSVNEASPRLMEALADGIGVPVGALRAMAEQGALTTEVLANGLPRALEKLREEAKSVETVGGAITVLKDKTMLLVGATAQSSGVVAVLSGGIRLLSDNLVLAGGAMATVAAVKLGASLASAASGAYASVVANNARLASNLAAARSDVAATASAAALASARVTELRAAVLAAEGNVALAITTNALIPAQAKATTAAAAHAAALSAQAAAAGAASVAGRAFSGVMALAGGPVGVIIGLLGVAATIWGVWASKAKESNDKVAQSTDESTADMIKRLDEQIAKLRERNALAAEDPRVKALDGISQVDRDGLERAREALAKNKADQQANRDNRQYHLNIDLRTQEIELSKNYEAALSRVATLQGEVAIAAARTRNERLDQWFEKNGTPAQRLAAELAELKKQFGAIPPEMEKLVRAKYVDPAAAKAISDQGRAAKEYADLLARINGKSLGVDSDYEENVAKLAAGFKAGKQSLAEYNATLEKYNSQQPRAKQAEEDRAKALKEISDFQTEYSKGLEATSTVYAKRLQDAETEASRNEDLARTYGMTTSAIEQLELARLEEQLAQRSTLGLTLDEIEHLEKLIDVKRRNAVAVSAMEQVDAAKKAAEEWKRTSATIEQSLTDALLRGFESGNGLGKNFVETMKNMFSTLVLRPVIQAVVAPASNSLAGMLGQGGSSGTLANAGSLINMGKTIYSGFTGGIASTLGGWASSAGSMFGSSAVSSFGAGLSAAGGNTGMAAMYASAQTSGNLAAGASAGMSAGTYAIPIAGWIAAGMALSNNLYKQGWDANNGTVNSLGKVVNAPMFLANNILKGIGLSDSAANIFAGMGPISKLFGRKNPEIEEGGVRGSISAAGFVGENYAKILEKGGWFRSDKRYTETNPLSTDQQSGFSDSTKALMDAARGFAATLGIEASIIDGYNKQITLQLGADEEKNKEAIAKLFGNIGDDLSLLLLPSVASFSTAGESVSTTMQRLVTDYVAIDEAFTAIGTTFGTSGAASLAAREKFLAAAGGLESFANNAAFFHENFLSEAERNAPVLRSVTEQMAALSLASVDTREEFKQAVLALTESGALATEEGAARYAALMKVQAGFAQVYPAIDATAEAAARAADVLQERNDLQRELDQLTLSAAELLAQQRAALDESNRGLFDQIQVIKAKTAAEEAATEAAQKAKDAAASLMSGVDGAFSVLQKVADRQKKALQEEINVRTQSVQKIEALSQSLRSTLEGMTVQGREAEDRQAAQAQIQAALAIAKASGKLPNADDLKTALSVVSKDSANLFATQEDYLRDFYATRIGIEDLAGLTDDALSVEERSLAKLEDQVKQYDLMLEREQEQIDVLKGISTIGLSIEQAIQALHGAMQAASANPVNSATSAINQAYQSALGRAPDQAGLDYWKDRAAGGISTGAIVDSIKGSPEAQIQKLYQDVFGRPADAAGLSYWVDRLSGGISLGAIRGTLEDSDEAKKKLRGFAVGTNFIPADMPAMVHQGERIIPAADNRELMRRLASPEQGSNALIAEIRALREEVALLRGEAERGTDAAVQLADQFDNVTDGGNACRVEVINKVRTKETA